MWRCMGQLPAVLYRRELVSTSRAWRALHHVADQSWNDERARRTTDATGQGKQVEPGSLDVLTQHHKDMVASPRSLPC